MRAYFGGHTSVVLQHDGLAAQAMGGCLELSRAPEAFLRILQLATRAEEAAKVLVSMFS
jgi:hypothetical protein